MSTGNFEVYNDLISVEEANETRCDFRSVRKMSMPWYKRDDYGDHLMLEWQGVRFDENEFSANRIQQLSEQLEEKRKKGSIEEFEDRRGYLKMQFKSTLEPYFKFIKVPEFDMPHRYYIDQINEMTAVHNQYEEQPVAAH